MAFAHVELTPTRVLDSLGEVTLFQNQGVHTMLLAFDELMTDPVFVEPWESITLNATEQPIWACTPISRNGVLSTLFWGPVVEELP